MMASNQATTETASGGSGCSTPKGDDGQAKRMSRRQKKNWRKREKEAPTASQQPSSTTSTSTSTSYGAASSAAAAKTSGSGKKRNGIPSKLYTSLNLRDDEIYYYLHGYILDQDSLRTLGFPLESQLSPGKAWVYQDPEFLGTNRDFVGDDDPSLRPSSSTTTLSAEAREFVPTTKGNSKKDDSGDEVASTLSASAKEFVPCAGSASSSTSSLTSLFNNTQQQQQQQQKEEHQYCEARTCARCGKLYYAIKATGECTLREQCVYHWGKVRKSSHNSRERYLCCGKRGSDGCEAAPGHVWRGLLYESSGQHKDLEGFARTRPPRNRALPADGNYGVYALDGEMVFTSQGLELCKVTVVGVDGRLVYESYVQPDSPIVDYNTRFSGVSAKDLKRGPTKSLRDVQNDLLGFVNANTILIGHGLENDLRALKLVHMTVIDTSLVYPHYFGMPFRRSLKSVVHSYLNREIQAENCGHDSYEDARACVELMLWKVHNDYEALSGQQKRKEKPEP